MPGIRDHEPIVIEEFQGWWDRGDPESAPSDHFVVANNIQYFSSGLESRDPIDKYQVETNHLTKIRRIYNYVMQTGQSLLVLDDQYRIWHLVNGAIRGPGGNTQPILTIPPVVGPPAKPGMEDFGFVAIAGRAYITPFATLINEQGVSYELGISSEFLYVYKGDGVIARKAAGFPPTNASVAPDPLDGGKKTFLAYNSPLDGKVTNGIHIIGVATNGGPLGTEVFPVVEAPGGKVIQLSGIPNFPNIGPLVMTKAIDPKLFKPAAVTVENGNVFYRLPNPQPEIINGTAKINTADTELVTIYIPATVPPGEAAPGTGGILVENTLVNGFCDIGFHLIGVVYETDTGYLTAPGPEYFGGQTYIDVTKAIQIRGIPIPPPAAKVVKRHIVSTKTITDYNGDQKGYQFFFVPKAVIENNVATGILINYYDSDLLSDASHLLDNYSEIPATVNLNTYHSRLVMVGDPSFPKKLDGTSDQGKPDNRGVAWLSAPGEPEAINRVDGLIVTPLDGNPLTNVQEFRDVLYLFKKNRTYAYSDNFDEPSTWQEEVLDQGVGAPVHGIATVLDSGGVNIDFLLIADWSGLMLFNGTYARPELSWKIEDYWMSIVRNNFRQIQIINDSLNKKIWMTLPDPFRNHMLFADYGSGLDAKNIKWAKWIFAAKMSSITLIDTDKVVLGSSGNA